MLTDHPQIEAVVVATSEWAHADPVAACLECGKHVLVEKPMATSPSDAAGMVHEADRNNVNLMVCHSLRFDPRFAAMREAVDRGEIGEVLHVYSRRSSQPAAVDRVLGQFPLGLLVAAARYRSGALDVPKRGCAGDGLRAIRRRGRQDLIVVVLTFDCGAVAVLENVWGSPAGGGTASEPTLHRTRLGRGRGGPSVRERSRGLPAPTAWRTPIRPSPRTFTAIPRGTSRSLIRHFAGVVRNLWKPLITSRDGLAVVRVASAVDASLKEARKLPFNRWGRV